MTGTVFLQIALRAAWLLGVAMGTSSAALAAEPAAAMRGGLFVSDDADDTSVLKASAGALFDYEGPDRYRGLLVEHVRLRFSGGTDWSDQRAYYAFAGGDTWVYRGQVGTDGDSIVGAASLVRAGRVRQEYFAERDVLETRRGIEGRYATFVGAAYDLPLGGDDRRQVTALFGAQDFEGRNLRTHARARYVHVLSPTHGVSAQVRLRAFHDSVPGELDYYSPRWFAEALPVVQVRRFRGGWMMAGALGWGRQRDANSAWRDARLFEAALNSPRIAGRGYLRASATYSNTPVGAGASYGYRQLSVEWVMPLAGAASGD